MHPSTTSGPPGSVRGLRDATASSDHTTSKVGQIKFARVLANLKEMISAIRLNRHGYKGRPFEVAVNCYLFYLSYQPDVIHHFNMPVDEVLPQESSDNCRGGCGRGRGRGSFTTSLISTHPICRSLQVHIATRIVLRAVQYLPNQLDVAIVFSMRSEMIVKKDAIIYVILIASYKSSASPKNWRFFFLHLLS